MASADGGFLVFAGELAGWWCDGGVGGRSGFGGGVVGAEQGFDLIEGCGGVEEAAGTGR